MSDDDDLSPWRDEPVFQALTAPASAGELAGEGEALAAFRAAVPVRSRRRFASRLGVGGSAMGIAIALSGGVAAAYTGSLPTPVQKVAHDVAGWAAVPAATPSHQTRHDAAGDHAHGSGVLAGNSTPVTAGASPAGIAGQRSPSSPPHVGSATSAAAKSSRHSTGPSSTPDPRPSTSAKPVSASSSTPTPTPSPMPTSPSPTPTKTKKPPVVVASITIAVSSSKVSPGGSVTVTGHLATATGAPVKNRKVFLLDRPAGSPGPVRVAQGETGVDGSVTLATPGLTRTTRIHLVSGQHRSAVDRVVVGATVSVSTALQGSSYSVSVVTDGGNPGDVVRLQRRDGGSWVAVSTASLDGSGTASFSVPDPPKKRPVRYRVVLPATAAHGYATSGFTVRHE